MGFKIRMFYWALEGACSIIYLKWEYEEEGIFLGEVEKKVFLVVSAGNLFIIEKCRLVRKC